MSDSIDWDALESEMAVHPEDEPVIDITALGDIELLDSFHAVDRELRGLSEMLHPRTDRGRELHSLRAALRITLALRGLM